MSLRARLSALTRAQINAMHGRPEGWETCRDCGAHAPGTGLHGRCRPCMEAEGKAFRLAKEAGLIPGTIITTTWRKE